MQERRKEKDSTLVGSVPLPPNFLISDDSFQLLNQYVLYLPF